MLSNDEIKEKVQGAFHPLRCVAEIWDYDHKLRFKDDNGIIEVPNVILRDVWDNTLLEVLIRATRERVKEKGFTLDPWP
jgi:hypothetical protein